MTDMFDYSEPHVELPDQSANSYWQVHETDPIATRNWNRARRYTHFCRNGDFNLPFLNREDEPQIPPAITFSGFDHAQNELRWCLSDLVHYLRGIPFLRAQVVYKPDVDIFGPLPPELEALPKPLDVGYVFEITLLDKLVSRPSFTYTLLLSKERGVADLLRGWGALISYWHSGEWTDFIMLLGTLTEKAERMNIDTALAFCPGWSSTPCPDEKVDNWRSPQAIAAARAETAIDGEIERMIIADRLAEISIPLRSLLDLPNELFDRICYLAMSPRGQSDTSETIWPYQYRYFDRCGQLLDHIVPALQLLRTSHTVHDATAKVLYGDFSYGFKMPVHAKRFFRQIPQQSLRFIRKMDLCLYPGTAMLFLVHTLGFDYGSSSGLDTYGLDEDLVWGIPNPERYIFHRFLEYMDQRLSDGQLSLTFRLTSAYFIDFLCSDFHKCCHFTLCKWIVKAVVDAVADFNGRLLLEHPGSKPRIKLNFKRGDGAGFHCHGRDLENQDAWLRKFARLCEVELVS